MNRAERRRQETQFVKSIKAINSLTPQQTRVIDIAVRERTNEKVNKLAFLVGRCTSAALVEKDWDFKEIEKFQLRLTGLLQEDTEKSNKLEKENINVMKIEKEVRNYIEGLLEKGLPKKKAIDDLVFKFPKLSKSMLLNAYAKVRTEREKECKITREKIVNSAKKHGLSTEGRKKIANDLGATLSTISTYVSRWKITEEEIKSEQETEKALEYIFQEEPKQELIARENQTTKKEPIVVKNTIIEIDKKGEEEKMKGLRVLEEKVVKSIKAKGQNGTYEAETGKGLVLLNEDVSISFKNEEQLTKWVKEVKEVLNMVK